MNEFVFKKAHVNASDSASLVSVIGGGVATYVKAGPITALYAWLCSRTWPISVFAQDLSFLELGEGFFNSSGPRAFGI